MLSPIIQEMSDKRSKCDGCKQVRAEGFRRRGGLHDRRKPCFSCTGIQSWSLPEELQAQRNPDRRHRPWTNGVRCPDPLHRHGRRAFWLFLPLINVAHGQTAHFHTVGIYETFSGPNSVPQRPSTWRCIGLTGTAQSVIVPLAETAEV